MDNSTTPPLSPDLLLVTQLELVTPTTVAGTLYGIAFTLFCLYVYALTPQLRNGDRKRHTRFMLAYSIVIMLCGLYNLVSNAWSAQDAYIKHSDYLWGPYLYIESIFPTSPVIQIGFSCQLTVDVLTSAIQVWRVWVIWNATRYANLVIVLPILSLLTFTGLKLRTVVLDSTLRDFEELISLDDKTQRAEYAVQGATTILCTTLISLYLIFKQWQQRKLIGKDQGSTGYMNVVAMIIESYAVESAWLVAIIALWILPAGAFFTESVLYIEIIAYLLVQYRVARGKSYESQREKRNVSSLHWNHSDHITTQFGETGEVQHSPHVSTVPQASNDARV